MHQPDKDLLVPGKILPWDIVDSSGRILLPKGLPVPDGPQAKQLWTRGYYVETIELSTPSPATAPAPSSWRLKPREQDMSTPKFFSPVSRMSCLLEGFFCEILGGKSDKFTERFGEFVRSLQLQVAKDPDAFLASVELFNEARYGTIHALHSAILCELVALQHGMRADLRRTLLAAALTRDVGFLEMQEELDRQQDPLTEEQQVSVRTHPLESAHLLREVGVIDREWLAAVEQHHERLNGSGYPNELVGDRICEWARILGIADIYSAMTKPRAYRAAIHSPNAIHSIFQSRGSLVDESFTQLFIKVLGVYPPGILVRLSTDEIAVVTRRTENLKSPELRVVTDPSDKLLQVYQPRDLSDGSLTIQEILPRGTPVRDRLNHRQLWGEGTSVMRR